MQRRAITPYEGTKPYVFVSYAHKDSHLVMPVLEQLYANKDSMGLVLLELPLPDMQGIDIIRQVNEDPQLMRIPVVALADDKAMEAELLNGGAMDFIAASDLRPDALLARVRHAIELSENRYIIRSAERDQLTGLYNKEFFFS